MGTSLWADVRFAARSLWKSATFTSLAILLLAVGIGATSAIFSLIDSTLLRPLPFADPDRLIMLWERPPGYTRNRVSPLNFLDWSEQNHVFESMAAVTSANRVLTGVTGAAERVPAQSVTTQFFDVLGIRPVAGRTFVSADAIPQPNVVIVSERFWQSHLDGDPAALGRVIRLDGLPFTVIGILPTRFQILSASDLWTPFPLRRTPEQRRSHFLLVIAKLKPGRTIDDARADMAVVAGSIARVAPETNRNWTVSIEPLRNGLVSRELQATSLVLGGVVMFVLLMACANVANLLLARGVGRGREIAVRRAIGGSTRHILRLLVAESVLLAMVGGAAGLLVSWLAVRIAPAIVPPGMLPAGIRLEFDTRVALFAAALTGITAVLVGIAPAWHAARMPVAEVIAGGGRSVTGTGRLRRALTIGEIAGAVLLLSGAGLLIRTLVSMSTEDRGYRAHSVLTMGLGLPMNRYQSQGEILALYRQLESAFAALPGVRAVGFANSLPLQGWDLGQPFEMAGDPPTDPSSRRSAHYEMVNPGYFEALGIPILKGRAFNERDVAASQPVCIVNEEFVRRHLHGREPLGMIAKVPNISFGSVSPVAREIVGVIKQVTVQSGETEKVPQLYVPLEQNAWYSTAIALRTDGNPMALAEPARAVVARIDRDLPLTRVRTMDDVAAESVMRPRFRAGLVGTLAVLALALAAVGVFGVLSFSVRERRREFGIRLALGAQTFDILSLVIGGGLHMAAAGITIGLVLSAVLARSLAALLYGVTPLDPITYATVSVILATTALIAGVMPALLALRTDPAVTVRQE
jgi:putative ABC transport system permease protein